MRSKTAILTVGLVLALLAAGVARAEAEQPNIVLILADDLGWSDLPGYGNGFNETPHIDRLARQGLRFTQFYAMPVCSPTRANLQSGQHPARMGITVHIPGHWWPFQKLVEPPVALQMPLDVETFAERLREAGYATGYFGKWHLGGAGFGPAEQGWDVALEMQGNTVPARIERSSPRRTAEYLTDRAVEFIEGHREQPFLLQVSHFAVHIPLSSTPELLAKYRSKAAVDGYPSRADYAALLEELDQSVGRITATLDRLQLTENTLLVFVSDNGGLEHQQDGVVVTSNLPLRDEKGSLYEGGIRVPCIVRWPEVVPRGEVTDIPAVTTDLYATFLQAAGLEPREQQVLDGISLLPLLRKPRDEHAERSLFWHLPHYHHSTPSSAMRRGPWKLIEFFEDGRLELYDLADDLGEQRNLAEEQPERARQMQAALARWRHDVQAQLPRRNPAYDPARVDEMWSRRKVAPRGNGKR